MALEVANFSEDLLGEVRRIGLSAVIWPPTTNNYMHKYSLF